MLFILSAVECSICATQLFNLTRRIQLTVLEWNERLWITLLDTATVQRDGRIVFLFKSGKEIIK